MSFTHEHAKDLQGCNRCTHGAWQYSTHSLMLMLTAWPDARCYLQNQLLLLLYWTGVLHQLRDTLYICWPVMHTQGRSLIGKHRLSCNLIHCCAYIAVHANVVPGILQNKLRSR